MEGPHVTICESPTFLWYPRRLGGREYGSRDKHNIIPDPSVRPYLRSGARASAARILKFSSERKVSAFVSHADEGKYLTAILS